MNKQFAFKDMKSNNSEMTNTEVALEKALNGDIPAAALKSMKLDQKLVSLMVARELLFLHYATGGAKMDLLSCLLFELHAALIEKVKSAAQ
jgi:hypothetical protein